MNVLLNLMFFLGWIKVPAPVSPLLALAMRILHVDGSRSLLASSLGVTASHQAALCAELPALHLSALKLLESTLRGVRRCVPWTFHPFFSRALLVHVENKLQGCWVNCCCPLSTTRRILWTGQHKVINLTTVSSLTGACKIWTMGMFSLDKWSCLCPVGCVLMWVYWDGMEQPSFATRSRSCTSVNWPFPTLRSSAPKPSDQTLCYSSSSFCGHGSW